MKIYAQQRLHAWTPSGQARTPKEIAALPEFRPSLAEGVFKLTDSVYCDNQDGIGNMPYNKSVLYHGLVGITTTDKFLSLVEPAGDASERADKIVRHVQAGYGIACPTLFLSIDLEFEELPYISGHEGRGRAVALQKLGIRSFPVHIILHGYRARHVTDLKRFHEYVELVISEVGNQVYRPFPELFKG